jgi:hypothetical protein
MLERIMNAGRRLLGDPPAAPASATILPASDSIAPRVLMVVHDPTIPSEGGKRLSRVFGWNDADALAQQYVADLREASRGFLNYRIVERIDADWFPPKIDGFRYTPEGYLDGWRNRRMHTPDQIDYEAQVAAFDLIGRYERGEIDEVWFFSFPYAGDYESTMVGRDAFWCNSPPVPNTGRCDGRFVVMAFNYERDVGCMLENFGHRVESIMQHVYRNHAPPQNLWELFTRYDAIAPGRSQCGNVHFAPNSVRDYDWGNRRTVLSYCDDWLTFPELPGRARPVNADEWGGGDMRLHHLWWLRRLPCAAGSTGGVDNNWWRYIVDPNLCD